MSAVRGSIRLASGETRPALAFTVRMPDLSAVDVVEYETAPDRWRVASRRHAATFVADGAATPELEPRSVSRSRVAQDADDRMRSLEASQLARRRLARAEAAERRIGHRATWWAVVRGERLRNTATLRGVVAWDVTCSCGWDSRTGGAIRQSVADDLWVHRTRARQER